MANRFYCLVADAKKVSSAETFRLLKEACRKRRIDFVVLAPPKIAYDLKQVPSLPPGGIYRQAAGNKRVTQYGFAIRLKNPHLKDWFDHKQTDVIDGGAPWQSVMVGELKGTAILPTLYGLTSHVDGNLIADINSKLDGFPVIVKKTGASHGQGVIKVDSAESLKSTLGHLIKKEGSEFVLRKYIADARHFRLVVLNNKVISSIEYELPADDFRTNTGNDPDVKPAQTSASLCKLAVAATKHTGKLFGGVDILVDDKGDAYIAEVNTPCNFARNQHCTGEDLAGQIVEFFTS